MKFVSDDYCHYYIKVKNEAKRKSIIGTSSPRFSLCETNANALSFVSSFAINTEEKIKWFRIKCFPCLSVFALKGFL